MHAVICAPQHAVLIADLLELAFKLSPSRFRRFRHVVPGTAIMLAARAPVRHRRFKRAAYFRHAIR